jgi:hypothetical protein
VRGADHPTAPVSALAGYLDDARHIFREAAARRTGTAAGPACLDGSEEERLRWFPLPGEVAAE